MLGPPFLLPTSALLEEIMTSQPLRAVYIPPSIIEHLLQEPGAVNLFEGLDFVAYTGGPLDQAAGEKLVQVTELISSYGSTEAFSMPQLKPNKEDWAYLEWNPRFKYEMQPCLDEEGTYEIVLFPHVHSVLEHNLPGIKEWRTKDLFKQHPKKPNLWRYYGRRDDIIVMSTGYKFNPVPFELALQSHPLLSGALVIGQGRPDAALLVEPKENVDRDAVLNVIWPVVYVANKLVPRHGHISRNHIIVAEKAFTRAGKGTVVRKLTENAFASEIEALYMGSRGMGALDYVEDAPDGADAGV